MYPLRYPLSMLVGALGVPLSIKIECFFDREAEVYIATSPDVPGFVAEAKTMDGLRAETLMLVPELLLLNQSLIFRKQQDVRIKEYMHLSVA